MSLPWDNNPLERTETRVRSYHEGTDQHARLSYTDLMSLYNRT